MDKIALNATLTYRVDINDSLAIVRVRPDSGVFDEFTPGQFAMLGLPLANPDPSSEGGEDAGKKKIIKRAYSIASEPSQRDYLEFIVTLIEEGALTPRLWTVHEGERLWLKEKITGHFTLEPVPAGADIVMLATGTGLAPFRSMLREYRGQGRWKSLTIVHGVRSAADFGYRDEFEQIASEDSEVHYLPVVTRDPGWGGLKGRIDELMEDASFLKQCPALGDSSNTHVLLCGNPAMIEAVQAKLEGRGFKKHTKKEPGNLHYERYW